MPPRISPLGTPMLLHRCELCGTYWIMTDRYAYIPTVEEAHRFFPESVPAPGAEAQKTSGDGVDA